MIGAIGTRPAAFRDAATRREEQELLDEYKVALDMLREPQSAFDEKQNPTQGLSPMILRAPGFGAAAPSGSIPLRNLGQQQQSQDSSTTNDRPRTRRNGYNVEYVSDEEMMKRTKAAQTNNARFRDVGTSILVARRTQNQNQAGTSAVPVPA